MHGVGGRVLGRGDSGRVGHVHPYQSGLYRHLLDHGTCTVDARGYHVDISRALLDACATAGRSCADECAAHTKHHEHCRICADAFRACEPSGRELLVSTS